MIGGGPLAGLTIIEMGGIGPAPFCGMMLADHGAEVIVIHRPGATPLPKDPLARSRHTVTVDLKTSGGVDQVRDLARSASGLIEGFRPGVMERLGLGPDVLLLDNAELVYGRMTGWGQYGPLSTAAGHDIDYIALSGALHAFGRVGDKPTPPINLVGDFGGGGMLLAFGMCAGILSAQRTGQGQVIDCAMIDGAAVLMSMMWGARARGSWKDERGVNLLDTGAPFYDTYVCADGKFVAVGAIEPEFYALFRQALGLSDDALFHDQLNAEAWPAMKCRLVEVFLTKTRDEWIALASEDACIVPVLSMAEAPSHPHNVVRGTFTNIAGVVQPAPAPRFLGTPSPPPRVPRERNVT